MKLLKTLLLAAAVAPGAGTVLDEFRQFKCGKVDCYWLVNKVLDDGTVETTWIPESKDHKGWRQCKEEEKCPGFKKENKGQFTCGEAKTPCSTEPTE